MDGAGSLERFLQQQRDTRRVDDPDLKSRSGQKSRAVDCADPFNQAGQLGGGGTTF